MKHKDILNKMTIEEKIKWTSGNDMWTFLGNERLGIKKIKVADGPHGVRVYKENTIEHGGFKQDDLLESTMFPVEAAMASTFNTDLLFSIGEVIGKECNMFGVDMILAPGVNQKRSPLGGRNFEYYSEDPFLTGKMATAFINGVQSTGVGACIKHFALNEQETLRRFIDSKTDLRTLHELYLLPFEMAMKEAKPFSVMSSYNKVNGVYAGESEYLLKDILRDMWNYKGIVMSDWGGVQNKVLSIKNGMNIEMPGPSEFENELNINFNNNDILESEIDKSLIPLLDLYEKSENNPNKGLITDLQANHQIASKVAEEAIVLLKNDGILPLKIGSKIGVIGEFASKPRINGGGSAALKPYILENQLNELKKYFEVDYALGYREEDTNDQLISKVEDVVRNNETILFFTGTTEKLESEGKEREHMRLPDGHLKVFNVIKTFNKKVIVVLSNGSALDLTSVDENSNAIIESWLLGGANARPLRKIITGEVNPSGRLSETFPFNIESTPNYLTFPSKTDSVNYCNDLLSNGYRHFDSHGYEVRYPFGYGLSYTKFKYSNLRLSKKEISDDDILDVTVNVENIGNYDGHEVVQLYVHDVETYYNRPYKELKGFNKVLIKKGERKDVTIKLDRRAFTIYSEEFKDFRVEAGIFEILIGSNVNNILLKDSLYFKTDLLLRKNFSLKHSYNTYLEYKLDSVEYIETKYRTIEWHEKEEPIIRVFNRLKREFSINDEDFNEMINKLR